MATAGRAWHPARAERVFYGGMATALLLIAFIGFAPSYYLRGLVEPWGRLHDMTPLVHLHGIVFSAWPMLLLATIVLMVPAIARLQWHVETMPPAISNALLSDLFLLALIAWDVRSRGRLHPATLWGGLFLVSLQAVRVLIMFSAPWLAFAGWATGLIA